MFFKTVPNTMRISHVENINTNGPKSIFKNFSWNRWISISTLISQMWISNSHFPIPKCNLQISKFETFPNSKLEGPKSKSLHSIVQIEDKSPNANFSLQTPKSLSSTNCKVKPNSKLNVQCKSQSPIQLLYSTFLFVVSFFFQFSKSSKSKVPTLHSKLPTKSKVQINRVIG